MAAEFAQPAAALGFSGFLLETQAERRRHDHGQISIDSQGRRSATVLM